MAKSSLRRLPRVRFDCPPPFSHAPGQRGSLILFVVGTQFDYHITLFLLWAKTKEKEAVQARFYYWKPKSILASPRDLNFTAAPFFFYLVVEDFRTSILIKFCVGFVLHSEAINVLGHSEMQGVILTQSAANRKSRCSCVCVSVWGSCIPCPVQTFFHTRMQTPGTQVLMLLKVVTLLIINSIKTKPILW